MGCHTWFYRKVERTQEEAKQRCLKKLRYAEQLNLKILNDKHYNGIDWEGYYGYTDESLIKENAVLQRQIRMVEKDLCQRAVWDRQNDEVLKEYVDGKGFYLEAPFHDVFRRGGYPDDKLFSLEETLAYINNKENYCEIFDDTVETLKQFWELYPDGMICFG